MFEDMTHLEIFDAHAREVIELIRRYNADVSGVTDKVELIRIRTRHIQDLTGLLAQQSRVMRYMAGEPVEPQVHFAESILHGVGGGGAQ